MKKIIAVLAVAVAAANVVLHAASPAATQAWVKQYVLSVNGGTNGVSVVQGASNTFYMTYALYDTYALGVTNSVHATITNGALFAYVDNGLYTNAQLAACIQATKTNMVWNGTASHTNALGQTMFGETFGVVGTMITAGSAKAIKGE